MVESEREREREIFVSVSPHEANLVQNGASFDSATVPQNVNQHAETTERQKKLYIAEEKCGLEARARCRERTEKKSDAGV